MKKIALSILLLLNFTAASYAAPDLMAVYKQALLHDQTFQSAKAQYLAATEAYPQARALLLPNINFQANWARDKNHIFRSFFEGAASERRLTGDFYLNSTSYRINIDQPVINFGAWFNLHFASYTVEEAAANYAAAAQDLLLRTAQAYFNVLESEDVLRFTQSEKEANERQLDQATQRFKVGLDAITSVYDAQASYDATVASEIEAKNNVVNSKEQLREITDKYYENIAKLKNAMPLISPEPRDVETWINKADQYNFTIQASRYAMEAARENIKIQFSGHLPTLDVVAAYDRSKIGRPIQPGFNDSELYSGGLQLNVPIFQGGLITSQTRQAKYEYENAIAQMEQSHREVSVQLRQTYNSIIAGISKIKADKQAIISRQASLDSTEAALKVGTRTVVDLLIAQQQLFQAQTTLAQDQYDYINNTLLFKQLAGTLTVQDLYAINTWLKGSQARTPAHDVYHVHTDLEKLKMYKGKPKVDSHWRKRVVNVPPEDGKTYEHSNRKTSKEKHSNGYVKKSKTSKAYAKTTKKGKYSIQLLARRDKAALESFIKQKNISKHSEIKKTKMNGKDWYILSYGNYSSNKEAKAALKKLPKSVNSLHPYVYKKSIA